VEDFDPLVASGDLSEDDLLMPVSDVSLTPASTG
jgi:hypothetical protein